MFDPVSFTIGLFSGGFLGAIGAIVVNMVHIHRLQDENTRLSRELLKLATRYMGKKLYTHDAKGRFRRINNNANG